MIYLRQSTASQEVPLGYFVDSTDGNTEKTALTIANTDIKIWKTGATTLASKNSGGATHISNGIYYAVLDATDTDTIGPMVLFVHVSTALTVRLECCVLAGAVFDVLFGTTAISTLAAGAAMTLTSGERDSIANALLDLAAGVETGWTLRQVQRQLLAMAAGITTGMDTTTGTVKNPAGTKSRVTATIDTNGNRTPTAWDNS